MSRRQARPPSGLRSEGMDDINRRILVELEADARLTTATLARRVGLSAPAVRDRVIRLEQSGVIRGYHVDLDPAAVGLPVAVWVRIRPSAGQLPRIAELAAATTEVSQCYRVSGEDCFLLEVHVPTIEALEAVLDKFLPYGSTTSSFVIATPVPPRSPVASAHDTGAA